MRIAERVSVTITKGPLSGKAFLLDVEEFLPYEPSNYVWTPGWNCAVAIKGETVWFFVDEGGIVWTEYGEPQGLNYECGICPAQEVEFEQRYKRENEMEATFGVGWPD
jgi:hypothetical protein